jgi:hypothetical protein
VFAVPRVPEITTRISNLFPCWDPCKNIPDRLALEGEVDDEGQSVCNQRADDRPADVREFPGDVLWEDSKVQKDNRNLSQDNDDLVAELLDPEDLYECQLCQKPHKAARS